MAKAEKAPKLKRVNRPEAANRVVSEMGDKATLTELAEKANAIVVASGGPNNVKDMAWHVRHVLATGESLRVFKLVRPTDIQVTRVKK